MQICEEYKVRQFYTAPTAIRALMKLGDQPGLTTPPFLTTPIGKFDRLHDYNFWPLFDHVGRLAAPARARSSRGAAFDRSKPFDHFDPI